MPDNSNQCPVYEICKVCATLKHQSSGPFPSSHEDVCCGLSTLSRSSPPTASLDDQASHGSGHGCCDLVCKNCPLRCKQACGSTSEVPDPPLRRSNVPNTGIRHRQGHKNPTLEIRPPRFKKKLWFGTYKHAGDVLRARDAAFYYMGFPNDLVFDDSKERFSKLHLGIQFRELDTECTSIVNVGGRFIKKHTYFAKEVKRVIKIVLSGEDKSSRELLAHQQPQTPDSPTSWGSHPLSEAIDPDVCLVDPSSIRPINMTSSSELQFTDTICSRSPTFSEDLAFHHDSSPNSLLTASPTQDASLLIDGPCDLMQTDLFNYQLIDPSSHCNITSAVTSEAVFPSDNTPVDWVLPEFVYFNSDSVLNPNFGMTFLPDSDVPYDFGAGGLIGPILGDHCERSEEGWRYNYFHSL